MQNLKNKTNEQTYQNRNKLIDAENKLLVFRMGGSGRMGEKGEWDKEVKTANYRVSCGDVIYSRGNTGQ